MRKFECSVCARVYNEQDNGSLRAEEQDRKCWGDEPIAVDKIDLAIRLELFREIECA